jgi:hypothetical protein
MPHRLVEARGHGRIQAVRKEALKPGLLETFTAQGIANILWGYATLRWDPGESFMTAMAEQLIARQDTVTPQGISNSISAIADLGYDSEALFQLAFNHASHHVGILQSPVPFCIPNG